MIQKPTGRDWEGVIGFTQKTPLGMEPPTYADGKVIPRSDYDSALPGWKEFFPKNLDGYLTPKPETASMILVDWARVAQVALARFPHKITDHALSQRLGEIRRHGYDVPPYSALNREGKYRLLESIKRDLRTNAKAHSTERVIFKVDARNAEMRYDDALLT